MEIVFPHLIKMVSATRRVLIRFIIGFNVLLLFGAIGKSSNASTDSECTDGDTFFDGCNWCHCFGDDANGRRFGCTNMDCPVSSPEKSQALPESGPIEPYAIPQSEVPGCSIGESYFDGCNWCHCMSATADGPAMGYTCTSLSCSRVRIHPTAEVSTS